MPSVFRASDWAVDADPGGLSSSEAVFESAGFMLTGSGNNIFDRASSGAEEFTDLISADIQSCANFDLENWGKAFFSCMYASSVAGTWKAAVEKYNSTIEGLDHEWGEAFSVNFGVDVTPRLGDDERADDLVDLGIAQEAKYSELKIEADAAREDLDEVADQVNRMLEEGPTSEEGIEYLVRNGYLGWAPYAIFGYGQPVPIDLNSESGEEWGERFADDVNSGTEISPLLLQTLTYLNNEAMRKLEAGEELTSEELDFLESFYGSLEGSFPVPVSARDGHGEPLTNDDRGVLALPQLFEDWEDAEREAVLNPISELMLHLSNEELGGRFDRLPSSVQNTTLGPESYPDGSDRSGSPWPDDLARLDSLLSHAGEDTQGGLTFSGNLTTSIGMYLEEQGSSLADHQGLLGDSFFEVMDDLVEVSTRNLDANHAILTGDFERPYFSDGDLTITEKTLAGLYGMDWDFEDEDREPAARNLTDWIAEQAWDGNSEERQRAAEAAVGLIESITSKDMYDILSGLGDFDVTDEDFNPDEIDPSFAALNPAIADSLASIYEVYIESFAGQAGMDDGNIDLGWQRDGAVWNDEKGTFDIGPGERLVFLEYLVGEDEAAQRVAIATEAYAEVQNQRHLSGGDGELAAGNAARAQILLDLAFDNESLSRGGTVEDAQKEREDIYTAAADLGGSALDKTPYIGMALSNGAKYASKEFIEGVFEDFVVTTPRGSNYTDSTASENYSRASVLDMVLQGSDGVLPDFKGSTETTSEESIDILVESGVLVEEGGSFSVQKESGEWNVGAGDDLLNQALSQVLQGSQVDWISGHPETGEGVGQNGDNALEFANNYSNDFTDIYRDVHGQLSLGRADLEELYSRHARN